MVDTSWASRQQVPLHLVLDGYLPIEGRPAGQRTVWREAPRMRRRSSGSPVAAAYASTSWCPTVWNIQLSSSSTPSSAGSRLPSATICDDRYRRSAAPQCKLGGHEHVHRCAGCAMPARQTTETLRTCMQPVEPVQQGRAVQHLMAVLPAQHHVEARVLAAAAAHHRQSCATAAIRIWARKPACTQPNHLTAVQLGQCRHLGASARHT